LVAVPAVSGHGLVHTVSISHRIVTDSVSILEDPRHAKLMRAIEAIGTGAPALRERPAATS